MRIKFGKIAQKGQLVGELKHGDLSWPSSLALLVDWQISCLVQCHFVNTCIEINGCNLTG